MEAWAGGVGRRSRFAAHSRRINGTIFGHRHGSDFALAHLVQYETFARRSHAHHQAAGIGAQNHVARGIHGHGSHVRFVALIQHAAMAIRSDAMDRTRIARGDQQVTRFVERQGPDVLRFGIVEHFALASGAMR